MKNVPKLVVDTNIILSGYLFGGKPRFILELAAKKEIEIITSSQILGECIDVLRKKFKLDNRQITAFKGKIKQRFSLVEPTETISFVRRDPDDNKFIEAAVEGKCKFIISGDKDLLDLKEYNNIKILNPTDFLKDYL